MMTRMLRVLMATLPLAVAVSATPAMADLYISPVTKDGVEPESGAEAALSAPVYESLYGIHIGGEHTTVPVLDNALSPYGSNVPLSVVMENIVPDDQSWAVTIDDAYKDTSVSWESESPTWTAVLSAIAEQNDIAIVFNHRDQIVGVAGNDRDALATMTSSVAPEPIAEQLAAHSFAAEQAPAPIVIAPAVILPSHSCDDSFSFKPGMLRQNLVEALDSCGFAMGDWAIGNSEYLVDFPVRSSFSVTFDRGIEDVMDVVESEFGVLGTINRTTRTVDFQRLELEQTNEI